MSWKVMLGMETSELVGHPSEPWTRHELAEVIRDGGPRNGEHFGWAVVDNIPESPDGAPPIDVFSTLDAAQAEIAKREDG